MWTKVSKALMRATGTSDGPSQAKLGNINTKTPGQQKATPFKERYTLSRSEEAASMWRKSITKSTGLPSLFGPSIASMLSNVTSKSVNASSSIKSCWNKTWSKYKFSSPTGARQAHFEAIRNEIMQKYGALANALLCVLSAAVTDAVFWWLAELLLDDGM